MDLLGPSRLPVPAGADPRGGAVAPGPAPFEADGAAGLPHLVGLVAVVADAPGAPALPVQAPDRAGGCAPAAPLHVVLGTAALVGGDAVPVLAAALAEGGAHVVPVARVADATKLEAGVVGSGLRNGVQNNFGMLRGGVNVGLLFVVCFIESSGDLDHA